MSQVGRLLEMFPNVLSSASWASGDGKATAAMLCPETNSQESQGILSILQGNRVTSVSGHRLLLLSSSQLTISKWNC